MDGPGPVSGVDGGARGGAGTDVAVGPLDHAGLADPAGENPEGAEVVLQGGRRQAPLFPGFGEDFHVLAAKTLHGVELVAFFPQQLEAGVQDIRPLVAGRVARHRAIDFGVVAGFQDRREAGFPAATGFPALAGSSPCGFCHSHPTVDARGGQRRPDWRISRRT